MRDRQALRQVAIRNPLPRVRSGRSELMKFGQITLLRGTAGADDQ